MRRVLLAILATACPAFVSAQADGTPVCDAAEYFGGWSTERLPAKAPENDPEFRDFYDRYQEALRDLHAVCAATPKGLNDALTEGRGTDWLVDADNRTQAMSDVSIAGWRLRFGGTPAQRNVRPDGMDLLVLQRLVYHLQGRLNRLRWAAYDAVTVKVEEKEVSVEKVVTKRDDRDVACRNAVNADIGETQAFLETVLQENNPFVGLFEEASRGSDSQFGPVIRQTKRAMLRERIEAALESLRGIRSTCSY